MGACARRFAPGADDTKATGLAVARSGHAPWRRPSPCAPLTHIKPLVEFATRGRVGAPAEAGWRETDPDDEREVSVAASREEIFERVKSVLSEQLGVDEGEVTEDASFQDDLDADSLDLVELIMELEDNFGMKIPDDDAQKITTVGQAVDYVSAHQ